MDFTNFENLFVMTLFMTFFNENLPLLPITKVKIELNGRDNFKFLVSKRKVWYVVEQSRVKL